MVKRKYTISYGPMLSTTSVLTEYYEHISRLQANQLLASIHVFHPTLPFILKLGDITEQSYHYEYLLASHGLPNASH